MRIRPTPEDTLLKERAEFTLLTSRLLLFAHWQDLFLVLTTLVNIGLCRY